MITQSHHSQIKLYSENTLTKFRQYAMDSVNGKYFYKYIVKLDYYMIIVPPSLSRGQREKSRREKK